MCSRLKLTNGHDANPSDISEILLTPVEQSAGGFTLGGGNHGDKSHKTDSVNYVGN